MNAVSANPQQSKLKQTSPKLLGFISNINSCATKKSPPKNVLIEK